MSIQPLYVKRYLLNINRCDQEIQPEEIGLGIAMRESCRITLGEKVVVSACNLNEIRRANIVKFEVSCYVSSETITIDASHLIKPTSQVLVEHIITIDQIFAIKWHDTNALRLVYKFIFIFRVSEIASIDNTMGDKTFVVNRALIDTETKFVFVNGQDKRVKIKGSNINVNLNLI